MKKYIIASLLAGVALMGFTSCEDDRDSNPTLTVPDSFVLNTPALAGNVYDLANCIYIISLNLIIYQIYIIMIAHKFL